MKILFITNGFSLPTQPGAPRPYQTCKWLVRNRHNVTVLCNRRHYQLDEPVFNGTVESPEIIDGIRIVGMRTPSGLRKSLFRRALAYFALTWATYREGCKLPKQDLVLVGTPPLLVPYAALLLARRFGARSVMEIRDLFPHEAEAIGKVKSKPILYLWNKWEQRLRQNFDHLVFNLPMLLDILKDENLSPDKVTVIPNGYDPESDQSAPLPPAIDRFFNENRNKVVVGYVGAMGHSWNIPLIRRVAERLRGRDDIVFFLLGKGEHKQVVEQDAAAQGLTNMAFFGPVSALQANTAVRRCQIMLMPFYENALHDYSLPNKLFDYLGAGRAIICAGAKQSAEIITAANGGIAVRADNAEEMADAVARLADHRDLIETLGRNSRRYVEEHLMRSTVYERWHRVLQTAPVAAQTSPMTVSKMPPVTEPKDHS